MDGILTPDEPVKELLTNFAKEKFDRFFVDYKMFESMFGHEALFQPIVLQCVLAAPGPSGNLFFTEFLRSCALREADIVYAFQVALHRNRTAYAVNACQALARSPLALSASDDVTPSFSPQTVVRVLSHARLDPKRVKEFILLSVKSVGLDSSYKQAVIDWFRSRGTRNNTSNGGPGAVPVSSTTSS